MEDGRSEDDKVPRGICKAVDASSGEIGMGKAEERRRNKKRKIRKRNRRKER